MCVNFHSPTPLQLERQFGLIAPEGDWPEQCWQDKLAPIIIDNGDGDGAFGFLASYGFIPARHQSKDARLTTMNARAETVGQLRSYRDAWRNCQLCLVPMQGFYEPCYESGRAVRTRIGMRDDAPFAVAGLWRRWQEADGSASYSFTQITINADHHPLMQRMHRPGDEKRSLVIIPREHWHDWLTCRDPELARAMLAGFPHQLMSARAEPLVNNRSPSTIRDLFDDHET
ncbi:SOS response-associated peptidase [Chromobacterium sp. IIBBL 290-4]|uniref:SOS response-associated peptidase n=1 Tax=Chromobacterium sp. IIBBL 290-4 TaxID=2953890 RepID=UPI0020B72D3A|nr:SOS response-associated peptidase family protein [Chromobacterium sp. IIBBL 290-4]UTH73287.1 SOS response-associated peptidase [Chromobacterium sp. IIBBL 290-4]